MRFLNQSLIYYLIKGRFSGFLFADVQVKEDYPHGKQSIICYIERRSFHSFGKTFQVFRDRVEIRI